MGVKWHLHWYIYILSIIVLYSTMPKYIVAYLECTVIRSKKGHVYSDQTLSLTWAYYLVYLFLFSALFLLKGSASVLRMKLSLICLTFTTFKWYYATEQSDQMSSLLQVYLWTEDHMWVRNIGLKVSWDVIHRILSNRYHLRTNLAVVGQNIIFTRTQNTIKSTQRSQHNGADIAKCNLRSSCPRVIL